MEGPDRTGIFFSTLIASLTFSICVISLFLSKRSDSYPYPSGFWFILNLWADSGKGNILAHNKERSGKFLNGSIRSDGKGGIFEIIFAIFRTGSHEGCIIYHG